MVKRGLRTAIESVEISLGLTEKATSEPYGHLKEVLYTKEKLLQRSEGGSMTDMFKTQQANQQHEGQEKGGHGGKEGNEESVTLCSYCKDCGF